ncbi:MAG TPA: hypothetical protein VGG62_07770, partial [Terracidiphilus sp.]
MPIRIIEKIAVNTAQLAGPLAWRQVTSALGRAGYRGQDLAEARVQVWQLRTLLLKELIKHIDARRRQARVARWLRGDAPV